MTDDDPRFRGRGPRADRDETFPPRLFETTGPALLGETDEIAALITAGHLLRMIAKRGGTRIKPSELEAALRKLQRSVPDDVRAHCAAEARLVADWIEDPPASSRPEPPNSEVERLQSSDVESRLTVARWALDEELDVEIEWYDEEADVWPRERATPLEVDDEPDDAALLVEVEGDELTIPVVHIRWLMPVERIDRDIPETSEGAKVLAFPGSSDDEER